MEDAGIVWPSRTYAAELLAWDVFLGLALVFAGATFAGRRSERTVKLGLLVCGFLCLAGTIGPVLGNMRLQLVGVLGYAGLLPVVSFLLARLFARQPTPDAAGETEMTHLLRITAMTALIMLCTLLPFLPGRQDSLAVPLSLMAQVIGTLGLVLVPIGALWLTIERLPRLSWLRLAIRLLALMTSCLVWAVVALAAAVQNGFALAVLTLIAGAVLAGKAWQRFRPRGATTAAGAGALPLYLSVVPIAVALLQQVTVDGAVTFSRNRAIRNSAPLIAAIEQYRAMRGRYPDSLLSVNPDYWPGVIGIPKYHYEPHGGAYNLVFEQFTYHLGTREFVVYNPRDEHVMTSHAIDLLELTAERLAVERTRGHYAVRDTPHRHWKYFWFD